MAEREKIRILQVTGGMNVGGAETWLMHVLHGIDRERFQFDFLVFSDEEQAYEAEILKLGGRIIRCSAPSIRPESIVRCLQSIRRNGPYDVMHCHMQHYCGVMLTVGKAAGIPIRIAQSHLDSSPEKSNAAPMRRAYFSTMEALIRLSSTHKLAVSDIAGSSLFGERWRGDSSARILYSGVDFSCFGRQPSENDLRAEFGLRPDSWVVGHVGRFFPQKNHEFIIDVAEVLASSGEQVQFLLVGDGPRRAKIEQQAKERGVANQLVFAGVRRDVPRLMLNAMDCFILPSNYEGLGLVGLEAQAAGLPSLFSTNCPQEVAVVDGLYDFLPIDNPNIWAKRILELRELPPSVSQKDALEKMVRSPFNIESIVLSSERIYTGKELEVGTQSRFGIEST